MAGGRPRGSRNKLTASAKEALETAFAERGGVKALKAWAEKDESGFYSLWGKLLPKNIEATGDFTITIERK